MVLQLLAFAAGAMRRAYCTPPAVVAAYNSRQVPCLLCLKRSTLNHPAVPGSAMRYTGIVR
jgi:hypothetical protein